MRRKVDLECPVWGEPRGGSRGAYLREDTAREGTIVAEELRLAKPAHHGEGGGNPERGDGGPSAPRQAAASWLTGSVSDRTIAVYTVLVCIYAHGSQINTVDPATSVRPGGSTGPKREEIAYRPIAVLNPY